MDLPNSWFTKIWFPLVNLSYNGLRRSGSMQLFNDICKNLRSSSTLLLRPCTVCKDLLTLTSKYPESSFFYHSGVSYQKSLALIKQQPLVTDSTLLPL